MECILRAFKTEDAKVLADIMNNKKIQDNLRDGLPYPYTVRDAENFISQMMDCGNNTFPFAIVVNGMFAGNVLISRKENIHFRTAEIGYCLGEKFWGQGQPR